MKTRRLEVDVDLLVAFWHAAHADSVQAVVDNRLLTYGVTRAALSGQLKKLNEGLGFSVWKDGAITSAGAELLPVLDRIFFDLGRNLDALRDRHQTRLIIGGSGVFTREHLPAILERALESAGDFTVVSQNRSEPELIAGLERGELHMIVVPLHHPFPAYFQQKRLLSLPLALLVPAGSAIRTAEELKSQPQIAWRVALPETSPTLTSELQRHLRRLGLRILKTEACALSDVAGYVATGKYLGLSLMEPNLIAHPGVRAIPLKKWRPIDIGVVWRPTHTALERRILELLEARARELQGR